MRQARPLSAAARKAGLEAADEVATLAALDAARAIFRTYIEAERGRVVDTAGESVLAIFRAGSYGKSR